MRRGFNGLSRNDDIFPLWMCVSYYSVRSVMHKYLVKIGEVDFEKVFQQHIGESFRMDREGYASTLLTVALTIA